MSGRIILFLIFFSAINGYTQENPWLFPIKPGKINAISGSVGELRNTHFHTGLDIKTDGVEGLPVYASDDGYISRIFVSPGGYGHALYIKHPNGYTTVYAHLSRFNKKIADYIRAEQYSARTFSLNRYPGKDMFPVTRGEVIAYSGNSGSSMGPHLHWDVRDPYQRPINSMSIPFEELRDQRPPIINTIAFRTMDISSRVNGEFGRFEFPVTKKGDHYIVQSGIQLEGSIGLEVLAYDKLDDSYNNCGISEFSISNDDHLVYQAAIENLSFSKQSSIYTFYNYSQRIEDGNKFTKLYVDDGNDLGFYEQSPGNGILHFKSDDEKSIEITLKDSYGNRTRLKFNNSTAVKGGNRISWAPGFSKDGNTLRFVTYIADNQDNAELQYEMESGELIALKPVSIGFHKAVFLHDLRRGIPSKAWIGGKEFSVPFKQLIPPGQAYTYYGDHLTVDFSPEALFDTLYIAEDYQMDSLSREIFSINNQKDPLKKRVNITLKPAKDYSPDLYSAYSIDEFGRLYFEGGTWDNGKINFRTQYFGKYTIAADTIPPNIKEIRADRDMLRFYITDNESGIDEIEATIDGKWILMHYDPKNSLIFSEKEYEKSTFNGEMLLEITDQQGNRSTFKKSIK